MNIKVTVNIVSSDQFGVQVEPPAQDPQMLLLNVPGLARVAAPDAAIGSLEMPVIEEVVPISYGVPRQTGLVPA